MLADSTGSLAARMAWSNGFRATILFIRIPSTVLNLTRMRLSLGWWIMSNPKIIQINMSVAKNLVRMLDRAEENMCVGCTEGEHEEACPAREMLQLKNYLTQRINNPNRNYGI
jgi:hypothetical protein